jgi:hypothetical protein
VPLEMTKGNYSNVGHRGPVNKGLGAMNPCDLYLYYVHKCLLSVAFAVCDKVFANSNCYFEGHI